MKKYLIEFIGAFFLLLTVILVGNNPALALMSPFAIGGIYLAFIYAASSTPGGYFNPAVTVALLIRRKLDPGEALYYIMVQLIASVLAAAIGVYLHDCSGGMDIAARVNEQPICTILGEFLGMFALVYVLLSVTSHAPVSGNSYYGLAIGFTLMAMSYAMNRVSGGIFNPAIVFGGAVAGMFGWDDLLVYLIGQILGAAAAATAIQLIQDNEVKI